MVKHLHNKIHKESLAGRRESAGPGSDSSTSDRTTLQSFVQVNSNGIAFFLADLFPNIRFYGQFVSAVSQSHERAAEWMAVDCATDLHQTSCAKECGGFRHYDVRPASFRTRLLQLC